MNLSQMETLLQRYGFDTTDPLAGWLNAAMHDIEISFDWPFLEEGPVTLLQPAGTFGQPAYLQSVPADLAKVITLYDLDHMAKIKPWSRHKFRRLIQDQTDQGLIEMYMLINLQTIQLWRVPQVPTNLELVYQGLTNDLVNSSDVPQTGSSVWPAAISYGIILRAAAIALQSENEEDRAKTAEDQYDRWLLRAMGRFSERDLDDVETVEDEQGYLDDMPIRGLSGGV